MILGGRLSEAGTGRQLLARAKDEPSLSVFILSTNTASNIRTRYLSSRKRKKKGQDLFPTLTPGPPRKYIDSIARKVVSFRK